MLIPWANVDPSMYQSVQAHEVQWICGPMDSPLDRYLTLQEYTDADYVVRLSADCPLINPYIILDMINIVRTGIMQVQNEFGLVLKPVSYLQNEADGQDVQIIEKNILTNTLFQDKEHVVNVKRIKEQGYYHPYEMHLSMDTMDQYKYIQTLTGGRK
jgi:spore coat polysaccharide biosynthesis protein SpsF (cytidylyltransferase family)